MSSLKDSYAFWADEANVDKLRKLYAEGYSNGQIAKAFGGMISRNAIIGKVNRLGLKRGGAYYAEQSAKQSAKRQAAIAREEKKALQLKISASTAPSPIRPPTPPPEPPKPSKALMLTLMELPSTGCKWPIGDDRPQRFCGQAKADYRYCAFHARESLPKERRDKPPMKATDLARGLRRFI